MTTQPPMRIQRKRTRGWRMPPNTVYVGRPTIYGNPFDYTSDKAGAVELYREWWEGRGLVKSVGCFMYDDQMGMLMGAMFQTEPHPLRGHNLACWCKLCEMHSEGRALGIVCADCDPCHVDVLLPEANKER